jgi:hypothetical protein
MNVNVEYLIDIVRVRLMTIDSHCIPVKTNERMRVDLELLQKYDHRLTSANYRLSSQLAFQSLNNDEYRHMKFDVDRNEYDSNESKFNMKQMNHADHSQHSMLSETFDRHDDLSKVLLIRKLLVRKSNELSTIKVIVNEKESLYRYLNGIYSRRQILADRLSMKKPKRLVTKEQD